LACGPCGCTPMRRHCHQHIVSNHCNITPKYLCVTEHFHRSVNGVLLTWFSWWVWMQWAINTSQLNWTAMGCHCCHCTSWATHFIDIEGPWHLIPSLTLQDCVFNVKGLFVMYVTSGLQLSALALQIDLDIWG